MKTNAIWKICCAILFIAPFVIYSSLVIPKNVFKPEFMGVPYTLWAGVSVVIFLWFVTFIAVQNHPYKEN